jgi:ubiquinone/menaquinone biosynthesis C-methylase UbiE
VTTGRTPQQTLAAVYDEGVAAYEKYWAPVLYRHALDLVNTVTSAAAPAPRIVVDVATGAGTLVPALRGLAGSGGRVIALDRSHGMLRRIPPSVPRVQADAAALPLRAASADVLVLAFVLFLLPDAKLAVAEAARVMRPGGWLLTATWGTQLNSGADIVVREELDAVGAPTFPVLERSDALTDTPDRMADLLNGGDFDNVNTSSRPLAATFDARASLAMETGCGVLGWRYRRLDPASREAVHRRATERLTALPPEAFIDRSEVLLTTARRTR